MALNLNKKKILIIGTIIIVILLILGFFCFIFISSKKWKVVSKERTLEEILKTDLTAPFEGKEIKIPQEIIDKISAFGKKIPIVPEEIIKSLTAPSI